MREDFIGYHCSICGKEYDPVDFLYTCPADGGNLDVVLDYSSITHRIQWGDVPNSREESLWRYLPLLPVSDPGGDFTPLHGAGWTKMYQPPLLKKQLGLRDF